MTLEYAHPREEWETVQIPLVEIFETVEGEGTAVGYPTTFIRLHGCPLRCVWCDTKYSYSDPSPAMQLSISEICEQVRSHGAARICLTGGEPLMYKDKSAALLQALAELPEIVDVHVETSGAIPLYTFMDRVLSPKVRYVMDYKLPGSGESDKMYLPNLESLRPQDELKFVIASDEDFEMACHVLEVYKPRSVILFSPVWGAVDPGKLVAKMLERRLASVKLSLQIHKVIWDPEERGV